MEKECNYILMDIGGTSIKCNGAKSFVRGDQLLLKESLNFQSNAKANREIIFDGFASAIAETAEKMGTNQVKGIGMAFPGPFDYERGISLMRGLDKYDAIYGIPIAEELKKRISWLSDTRFLFLHDIEAFAVGESRFGEVRSADRFICLCIGTGTGSAFVEKRQVLKAAMQGVPLNSWLYNTPFKKSIIDDYLSVRGLEALSRRICGGKLTGLELWERAIKGGAESEAAKHCFKVFGEDLKEAMIPYLDGFKPEAVVMGGQISKSFSLFGEAFESACKQRGIRVYTEPETSVRAMQGLYVKLERSENDAES